MEGAEEDGGAAVSARESDCSFEWDEASKLYFHARTGFYHDPMAGWYYSSRDGFYYTFENGSYVLLDQNKDEVSDALQSTSAVCSEAIQENHGVKQISRSIQTNDYCLIKVQKVQSQFIIQLFLLLGITEYVSSEGTENQCPPSEWLEETLIDLYLSGYPRSEANAVRLMTSSKTEAGEERDQSRNEVISDQLASEELPHCHEDTTFRQKNGGEWNSEGLQDDIESNGGSLEEAALGNEENWRAQYGQVVHSGEEDLPSLPVVELWDWEVVVETVKKKEQQVSRLLGRLIKRSSKLHPSVPVGGGLLKTAAIRDVHLDLVRVTSGKVYRLRSPSKRYLSSLSSYDSSNPTKDWGFPDLLISIQSNESTSSNNFRGSDYSYAVCLDDLFSAHHQISSSSDKGGLAYRDRAAERRNLHGRFSIGPGQKHLANKRYDEEGSSSESFDAEEAAAESLNITFGHGSYSRRILESMGWKEGEALGNSTKGILEPLQPVGNKGYAGLGWNNLG